MRSSACIEYLLKNNYTLELMYYCWDLVPYEIGSNIDAVNVEL